MAETGRDMRGTTEIKRWLALLLGIASPPVAMLYLGRPVLAGVLFLLGLGFEALMWLVPVDTASGLAALGLGLMLVGGATLVLALRALLKAWRNPVVPAAKWRSVPALLSFWLFIWAASPNLWLGAPFRSFTTAAAAMAPTLAPGDLVMAEMRVRPKARAPQPGDVVVFRHPSEPGQAQVKRVVALAGDEVRMEGGVLHINGTAVKRDRLPDREAPPSLSEALPLRGVQWWRETLPNGRSYVTLKYGEAAQPQDTTEPLRVPAGHVYVLGDNRDNTVDSRVSRFGPVAAETIFGRLMLVEWSREARRIGRPVE